MVIANGLFCFMGWWTLEKNSFRERSRKNSVDQNILIHKNNLKAPMQTQKIFFLAHFFTIFCVFPRAIKQKLTSGPFRSAIVLK
jgi:hypothetical protein